jgi:hypothetical protein
LLLIAVINKVDDCNFFNDTHYFSTVM